MGQELLRKLDFAKNGILPNFNFSQDNLIFLTVGEDFTFVNACAVQTKQGTSKLSNKNRAKEHRLLATRSRSWKIICSFQVPLYLGLKRFLLP